ncbi:MAG: hypothetical protein R3Y35_12210 [Clostridia bacterium]
MKIIKYFLKDIFSGFTLVIFSVVLILSLIFTIAQYQNSLQFLNEYNEVLGSSEGLEIDEARDILAEKLDYYSKINSAAYDDLEEKWFTYNMIEKNEVSENEFEEAYNQSQEYLQSDGFYSEKIYTDLLILSRLSGQLIYNEAISENLFLNIDIYERNTERIYSEDDTLYWNLMIEETENIETILFYDTLALQSFFTVFSNDWLVLIFIVIVSSLIFSKDYSRNKYLLNSSFKMFGIKYSLYKLSSVVILTIISVIVSILLNLAVFLYADKTPEVFLQPIQILDSSIVSNLNVLEYFIILVFQKIVAYISLALLISAISLLCKKYVNSFVVSFAIIMLSIFVAIILELKINIINIFSLDSILILNSQILMRGRLIPISLFVYLCVFLIGIVMFILITKFYKKLSKFVYWR